MRPAEAVASRTQQEANGAQADDTPFNILAALHQLARFED